MKQGIPSYVLNEFLLFERKVYQIGDVEMPRPISLKTLGYFITISLILVVLLMLPGIGHLMRLLPWVFGFNVFLFWGMASAGITALLTEVGTENRMPLSAFQSMCRYYWLRMKKESYYEGKILTEEKKVVFDSLPDVNVLNREQHQKAEKPLLVYKPVKISERGKLYEQSHTISSQVD